MLSKIKNINITGTEIDEFINEMVFNNLPTDFIQPIMEEMKNHFYKIESTPVNTEKTFSSNINIFLKFVDYNTENFMAQAQKEQIHKLVLSDSDCFIYHFFLEDGEYNFCDGEKDFNFVVKHERQYDLSFTEIYFRRLLHLVRFKKELTNRPFSYLYQKEKQIMNGHEKRALSEWKKLGPTKRTALFTALQANERSDKFCKICWKNLKGLEYTKTYSKATRFQQEIVKEEIRYGFYLLAKENDSTDSAEIDIKSTLDDYDNYNYTNNDIVVDLEGTERNYGYYGW